jgi:hypothetical protein|tara:strand:+ start:822 stop:953 length:132 start_codon:yes stop_codon:yes gene_type:complete
LVRVVKEVINDKFLYVKLLDFDDEHEQDKYYFKIMEMIKNEKV